MSDQTDDPHAFARDDLGPLVDVLVRLFRDPDGEKRAGPVTAPITPSVVVVGAVTGLLGAGVLVAVGEATPLWVPAGLGYGLVAALVFGGRSIGPGRGLVWGLGAGALLWTIVAFTVLLTGTTASLATVRALLPVLVGVLLGLAAPVGLAVGLWQAWRAPLDRKPIDLSRAVAVGGLSGIVGGWAFGVWMAEEGVLLLIAGLVGSTSPGVGRLVHFTIAVTIGATFGLLFQRDARGLGSSLGWGMTYGLFWWLLGALTLLPLFLGRPVAWDAAAMGDRVGTLIGHVVYGLLLGLIYSLLDRLWLVLFYESDPLNREVEGPGIRLLQAATWGILASVAGVLLFGVVLWRTDNLPVVARLVGQTSPVIGFLVHMGVGSTIGITYGQLFRYESPDLGSGIAWGLVYGLIWWFLGPLTLLPTFLGNPLAWNATAVASSFPTLVGHLLYGAPTGATFYLLERRQRAWARLDPRIAEHDRKCQRNVGTPAPAVWLFTFTIGVFLLLIVL